MIDVLIVVCFQTGWMMWNWFVSALAVGAAIVCYDGSPLVPNANIIWDLVDQIGCVLQTPWLCTNCSKSVFSLIAFVCLSQPDSFVLEGFCVGGGM